MRVERDVSVKSKIANRNPRLPSAEAAPLPAIRHGFAHVIYVAATAVATLGWLWLIGWIALKLT
jgi:hypothetical protein